MFNTPLINLEPAATNSVPYGASANEVSSESKCKSECTVNYSSCSIIIFFIIYRKDTRAETTNEDIHAIS